MAKPRYKVNLPNSQSICDMNYAKLQKLMPGVQQRDHWHYRLTGNEQHPQDLTIRITERAPYTTMVQLEQEAVLPAAIPSLVLSIRIYHDVTMAEVVAWSRQQPRQGNYEYPNKHMYHADEKVQLNLFLSDWLSLCLAQGHILDNSSFTNVYPAVIK